MKAIYKIIWSTLLLFIVGFNLSAQSEFGFKVGANHSDIGDIPSGNINPDPKTFFHAGVAMDIRLNRFAVISPEVLLSFKGANYTLVNTPGFSSKVARTLSYIEIPVSVKYQQEKGLMFGGGLYAAILAGARDKQTIKYTTLDSLGAAISSSDSTNITSDTKGYNPLDFGFHFTLGYKFKMGLFFAARYEIGLSKVFKENKTVKPDPGTGLETSVTLPAYGRNTNIQFSIGWLFGGDKKRY